MIKDLTPLVAIVVIGALEGIALAMHINGAALAGALVIIAGLGGYQVKSWRERRRNRRQ